MHISCALSNLNSYSCLRSFLNENIFTYMPVGVEPTLPRYRPGVLTVTLQPDPRLATLRLLNEFSPFTFTELHRLQCFLVAPADPGGFEGYLSQCHQRDSNPHALAGTCF